jgi:hypothetical protein
MNWDEIENRSLASDGNEIAIEYIKHSVPERIDFSAASVAPGPTVDVYAYIRESVQRNLYRIPLP